MNPIYLVNDHGIDTPSEISNSLVQKAYYLCHRIGSGIRGKYDNSQHYLGFVGQVAVKSHLLMAICPTILRRVISTTSS